MRSFGFLILALQFLFVSFAHGDGANISTQSKIISVTPVISSGVAYTANDALGDLMTFTGATGAKRTGVLTSLLLLDKAKQNAQIDIVCWKSSVTATADNAAWAISDADNMKAQMAVSIPTTAYIDVGGSSIAVISGIAEAFATDASDSLYCQMATRGTPTYGSVSDIQVTLGILQD